MRTKKLNTLCIIPARGGSKGIPGKNIIDVKGKPLIAYTIEPALKVLSRGLLNKVIVSTDSKEIAEVAKHLGAEVPFLRPGNISGDKAKSVDFMKHALDYYAKEGIKYNTVLLLQPTSPLRKTEDIEACIDLYAGSRNDSLITAYEEEYINDLVLYRIDVDGKTAIPMNVLHNKGVRRQDHGSLFVRNGCIYISSASLIANGLVIGESPLMYIMEKSRSINVDTQEDLELLRRIL